MLHLEGFIRLAIILDIVLVIIIVTTVLELRARRRRENVPSRIRRRSALAVPGPVRHRAGASK